LKKVGLLVVASGWKVILVDSSIVRWVSC